MILALGSCRGGTTATETPTPTPTVSASPSKKPAARRAGSYVVTAQGCLRLRSEAGLQGSEIVCVPTGETVKADGAAKKADDFTWYRVTYKGKTGWAASQYLARKVSS